jgi:site-specific recombinase XerD
MILNNNFDFPIYVQKFIRHLERLEYSKETITGYSKDLSKFKKFLFDSYQGSILTEQIQKEDVLDYLHMLKSLGLKPNSVSRNLSTLKSFYKFLVYEMNFKVDVGARVKQPKIYTPLPEILDPHEVASLLAAAEEYSTFYFVFFSLIYFTGSRLTPIRILRKDHVDLVNKKIYLEKTKNGQDLHLPLLTNMCSLLNTFLLETNNNSVYVFASPKKINQPISPADVRVSLKKISRIAGIKKRVTPHLLRHCTATHLTLNGVDQKFIASILGHVDLRSTSRYQQLNVENLRPALNKLTDETTFF